MDSSRRQAPLRSVLFDQEAQQPPAPDTHLTFYSSSFSTPTPTPTPGASAPDNTLTMSYTHYGGIPIDASDPFANEPPLLDELGINFSHIFHKTKTVLNPLHEIDPRIMDDTDLAGPLFFCLLLGCLLLLSGKVHFGYIYGVGVIGCVGIYAIFSLMSEIGIDFARTTSVLGYCLLPIIVLAALVPFFALRGWMGLAATLIFVSWSTYVSTKMFVAVLRMRDAFALFAYPVFLLYAVFALITIF